MLEQIVYKLRTIKTGP